MIALKGAKQNSQSAAFTQKEIDKAWDRFISKGAEDQEFKVRSNIISSWQRCLSEGVDLAKKAAPLVASEGLLHQMRSRNRDLLSCAKMTIDQARVFLQDLETVLFLTDRNALNLEVIGDPRTLEAADPIGLIPGSGWLESLSGSNAVGTAIETNLATQVHGVEHFCEGFKSWSCTAACIYDSYDAQRIGVIDVSGLTNTFDRWHLPLVVSWANAIQTQLAMLTAERWSVIEDALKSDTRYAGKSDFILCDLQGRFIRSSDKAGKNVKQFLPNFEPGAKFRLALDKFGGEATELETVSGDWLEEDWIQPVKQSNGDGRILGFKINLPGKASESVSRTGRSSSSNVVSLYKGFNSFAQTSGIDSNFSKEATKARMAAKTPLPILLLGETGCGKEFYAKAIHAETKNPEGPFIDLNCGAFSRDLLNSELFGHVEGAFTGAKKGGMLGKIEAANGGTLFLDEIGEMPLDIQPIFLRVLQEKQIYRVGDIKARDVDFKLIAATNIDLKKAVEEGRFRKDLYYRISSVLVELKPLSQRKEEIPAIVESILQRISDEHQIDKKIVGDALMAQLQALEWPGNIRELSNVLEFMSFMAENQVLEVDDLPDEYKEVRTDSVEPPQPGQRIVASEVVSLEDTEKQAIAVAIETSGNNLTRAAKMLGIAKSTLYQKIKKYEL